LPVFYSNQAAWSIPRTTMEFMRHHTAFTAVIAGSSEIEKDFVYSLSDGGKRKRCENHGGGKGETGSDKLVRNSLSSE
jgi:hypothetical protein